MIHHRCEECGCRLHWRDTWGDLDGMVETRRPKSDGPDGGDVWRCEKCGRDYHTSTRENGLLKGLP